MKYTLSLAPIMIGFAIGSLVVNNIKGCLLSVILILSLATLEAIAKNKE